MLGYEPELLLGAESGALVHDDEHRRTPQFGRPGGGTCPAARPSSASGSVTANGTWRWLEGIATNLLDDPAVQGVVINARDVTERRAVWSDRPRSPNWAETCCAKRHSHAVVRVRDRALINRIMLGRAIVGS